MDGEDEGLPGVEHEQPSTESSGPVATGWHLPSVHSKSSGQSLVEVQGIGRGTLETQSPDWQVPSVPSAPFVHAVPSALLGLVHIPVTLSHTPISRHWLSAAQITGAPETHVPD